MLDVSFLYCGRITDAASHRYGVPPGPKVTGGKSCKVPPSAAERKPIVVWNITRRCNLKCRHCYSDSANQDYAGELSTEEAKAVIDDLASFQVHALLFSGGEPLLRKDIFELAGYAREKGLRTILSTNATLVTKELAVRIRETGFFYVGVSLDGIGEVHDRFRGAERAFDRTLEGIRHLIAEGQKTGLRLTMTDSTLEQIDALFDLAVRERIERICFYHLVPSGRGKEIFTVSPGKVRKGVEKILEKTGELFAKGHPLEVLTVDNHADGPYLYLKLKERSDPRAGEVLERLSWNGGGLYSSGVGISAIDSQGNVHPDQFWTHYSLGNVRERKFSEIWTDAGEPLLRKLRNRKSHIHGRCLSCRFLGVCGGSLRVRAELLTGNAWAPDPSCYLTDAEIGLAQRAREAGEPKLVFWETTTQCNLRCIHCRRLETGGSSDELSTDEGFQFIQRLSSEFERSPVLVLSGGEPLVRKDIFDLARFANGRGIKVALATNATLVTGELAAKMKESGVGRVSVSLDGASAGTHDRFRNLPGSFEMALRGIAHLKAAGIPVQLNATISRHNVHELGAIYRLSLELCAETLHYFLLVPVGCGLHIKEEYQLTPREYEATLRAIYDQAKENRIFIRPICAPHYFRILAEKKSFLINPAFSAGPHSLTKGCLAGSGILFVSSRGEVFPCGYLPLACGNVREAPLKKIWEEADALRQLRDPDALRGKCGICGYKKICSGCRARAFEEHGDFLAEEPNCSFQPAVPVRNAP